MAHGQLHLTRRGNVFWFSRRLPSVRHDFPQNAFLRFSLRTDILATARLRARRLTSLTDYAAALLESSGQVMTSSTIAHVLTELARFEIVAADQARRSAPLRSHSEAEAAFAREAAIRETLREAFLLRDREVVRAPLLAVCRRLGVDLPACQTDWHGLADEAIRVLVEVSEAREARDRGEFETRSAYVTAAIEALEARAPKRSAPPAAPSRPTPLPLDAFAITETAHSTESDVRPRTVPPRPTLLQPGAGQETPAIPGSTGSDFGDPVPARAAAPRPAATRLSRRLLPGHSRPRRPRMATGMTGGVPRPSGKTRARAGSPGSSATSLRCAFRATPGSGRPTRRWPARERPGRGIRRAMPCRRRSSCST